MYVEFNPRKFTAIQPLGATTLVSMALLCCLGSPVLAQPQVIRNITQASERLELTVNTSRILTLDKRIPRMVVNNPELVTVTPISANQVQLAARKPGVTQVNLWDEDDKVYTVDVVIYGDVRELELAFARLFPESSVKVVRLTNSLVLEGFVERPESVGPMLRLAEDYAPKIVNNITVGGMQQILLKVKVMEVSRTKMRNLGFDFAAFGDSGGVVSSISDIIQQFSISGGTVEAAANAETLSFGVLGSGSNFFGFLQALQENQLGKILADPTITTVSGRPAQFNVGGEIPVPIPQGLNQVTIEYKPYGTQIDFVPIVLGNGNIRLEVRPRVSDLDPANAILLNGSLVPALRVRQVDTGVELKAGQTLALAGLVQTRVEANERGIPYISDVPYLGALFRDVQEEVNEIELLILVTPEFADGMEPHEVPHCGPGMETVSPNNCQLYFGGHLEVPACGPCAPNGCVMNCATAYNNPQPGGYAITSDVGANYVPAPAAIEGQAVPMVGPYTEQEEASEEYLPAYSDIPAPEEYQQQQPAAPLQSTPAAPPAQNSAPPAQGESTNDSSAIKFPSPWQQSKPVAEYNRQAPQTPTLTQPIRSATSTPGLIGPIGYDMEK
jgi:pilus assembly protein CpaC